MAENELDLDKCFEVVMKLVDEAGKIVAERNDSRQTYVTKSGATDLVTETDQEVEKLLMNGISAQFPNHKFIGEEETSTGKKNVFTNDPTWIIDPVDGTMNFVHSFPHSSISIALYVDKVGEIGIIYNPILNQKFTARRGKGAFYNGKRIAVSGQTEINKALVISEFGTSRDPFKLKIVNENFSTLSGLVHGLRVLGSAALNISMVAMGAADVCYEMGIHVWDIAAAIILVKEAGGVVIDPAGGEVDIMSRRVLCASSMDVASDIAHVLKQYYPEPRDD